MSSLGVESIIKCHTNVQLTWHWSTLAYSSIFKTTGHKLPGPAATVTAVQMSLCWHWHLDSWVARLSSVLPTTQCMGGSVALFLEAMLPHHNEDSLTTTIYVSVPTPTLRTTSTAYRQSPKWFVSGILTEGFIETLGTGVYFQWMASLKIPINILFSVIH